MTGVFITANEKRYGRLIGLSIELRKDKVDGVELTLPAEPAEFGIGNYRSGTELWVAASGR